MTKTQKAKVRALDQCRLPFAAWDLRFISSMARVVKLFPDTQLTKKQQWGLDCLVYKFRRQLAQMDGVSFDIPTEPPKQADYGIKEPEQLQDQMDLDGSHPKPHANPVCPTALYPSAPQKDLF